mmetsp:Transcript_732/g.1954  ORF Transcript_732/g.1954 Transcript_732/m.1954 type:complete len:359 (+) Transcript_732:317-1393(+)
MMSWLRTSLTRALGLVGEGPPRSSMDGHCMWHSWRPPQPLWHSATSAYSAHFSFFSAQVTGMGHEWWHCTSEPHSVWQAMWDAVPFSSSTDAGIDIGHFIWQENFWNGQLMPCASQDWWQALVSLSAAHCSLRAPMAPRGHTLWQAWSWPQDLWQLRTSSQLAIGAAGSTWSTTWLVTSCTRLQGSCSSNSFASWSSLQVWWSPPFSWHSITSASLSHAACFCANGQLQECLWQALSLPQDLWQIMASPSLTSSFTEVGLALGHCRWHSKTPWLQARWHALISVMVVLNRSHCSLMRTKGHARPSGLDGRYFSKMPSTVCCKLPGAKCALPGATAARNMRPFIAAQAGMCERLSANCC